MYFKMCDFFTLFIQEIFKRTTSKLISVQPQCSSMYVLILYYFSDILLNIENKKNPQKNRFKMTSVKKGLKIRIQLCKRLHIKIAM